MSTKAKFKGGKPQKETANNRFKGKPKDQKAEREIIFPQGVTVFSPNEEAPDFVKAEVIISVDQFMDFVTNNDVTSDHKKYGQQLRLSLKESKDGRLYFEVNTYHVKK